MDIGLVLSGGMAKGAYQIGALKAIREFIPPEEVKYMSCASVGVLNGYAFATDRLEKAEKMWLDIVNGTDRALIGQILKSTILQDSIVKIYDPEKSVERDFYCSLLDITNRNIVYKNMAKADPSLILRFLRASVAMPVYNRAVKIGENAYYDGAMIDNIPVYPLMKHRLDYMICIYFDDTSYKFENVYFDNKIIKLAFPADSFIKKSLVFRRDNIEEMISAGYERTRFILRSVFADGYKDVDSVYRAISVMNSRDKSKTSLRITGDVLVTNLNKVTQRLTKRKIL